VYQPLKNTAGEITGIIQIVVEVTGQVEARRKVEESQLALQQANEQLAAANEELYAANEELSSANGQLIRVNADLDNFVYAASHDLKSPILNIEGLLRVLVKKLPPDNPQEPVFGKAVDLMRDAISRFKGTISDLTEITKIGKANEEITAVELPEVIRHVLLDLEDSIGEADAGVAVEVSQCPEIAFSRKNLHSIVYNLVSNAVKYRSPHRHLELGITCRVEGEYLVLSVADNGLGMDLSGENKIFTMFKRLHNHVEGSGIGLYIVKKIVDNAGGRIEVESQVDAGSTFRVYLRR
jgi:signal transduction histidine kinase